MDYETKPVSRKELRKFAKVFRMLFGITDDSKPFPIVEILDRIPDVFKNCGYRVVDDAVLGSAIMARCTPNNLGGYDIDIKQSIYDGACRGIGAYRGFICHELAHVFLFMLGYTPLYNRSFAEGDIPAYKSVEWQAKALAAEIMIPYHASIGMSSQDIYFQYNVSKAFADHRVQL